MPVPAAAAGQVDESLEGGPVEEFEPGEAGAVQEWKPRGPDGFDQFMGWHVCDVEIGQLGDLVLANRRSCGGLGLSGKLPRESCCVSGHSRFP